MCNWQLFAMTASNGSASHSSTWYSCKNSLHSLALTSGRRQCPPLFFRHILCQLPHQPHTTSHVSVMHIWPSVSAQPLAQLGLILCQLMSSTSCVERKFNRTLRGQKCIFHAVLQPSPLRQEQGVSWELRSKHYCPYSAMDATNICADIWADFSRFSLHRFTIYFCPASTLKID